VKGQGDGEGWIWYKYKYENRIIKPLKTVKKKGGIRKCNGGHWIWAKCIICMSGYITMMLLCITNKIIKKKNDDHPIT
jgi:hypothetical protein